VGTKWVGINGPDPFNMKKYHIIQINTREPSFVCHISSSGSIGWLNHNGQIDEGLWVKDDLRDENKVFNSERFLIQVLKKFHPDAISLVNKPSRI
jgi:hypothetical protein